MRFYLDGEMPPYLLAKDIILQVGRRLQGTQFRLSANEQRPAFHLNACSMYFS